MSKSGAATSSLGGSLKQTRPEWSACVHIAASRLCWFSQEGRCNRNWSMHRLCSLSLIQYQQHLPCIYWLGWLAAAHGAEANEKCDGSSDAKYAQNPRTFTRLCGCVDRRTPITQTGFGVLTCKSPYVCPPGPNVPSAMSCRPLQSYVALVGSSQSEDKSESLPVICHRHKSDGVNGLARASHFARSSE